MQKKSESDLSTSRLIALEIVYEVMEKGAYANLALDKILSQSGVPLSDRRIINEMANGTIRMIKHLDWVLNLFVRRGLEKQNPWLRNILRISAYQILFMNKIPAYACVNDAVKLVRNKTRQDTLAAVANGVLRNLLRNKERISYPEDRVSYLAVYYSHPEWLVKQFLDIYGWEDTIKILEYNNQPPQLVIRNNVLKCTREELIKLLEDEGVECQKSDRTPWGVVIKNLNQSISELKSYNKGLFYVQNEASMLAAPILNPQPGDNVLDLCSGVGGKTTHMAEYMQNRGRVTACELYEQKIKLLNQNSQRLGISIIDSLVRDILNLESEDLKFGSSLVLLDAPCSGLGVLNRRSDLRWKKQPGDEKELTKLQAAMLNIAAERVLPGGLLLYSTCTNNPNENQKIIQNFLQNHNFVPVGFADRIGFWNLDPDDVQKANTGMLTIVPGKYLTDGMFYALMRRQS